MSGLYGLDRTPDYVADLEVRAQLRALRKKLGDEHLFVGFESPEARRIAEQAPQPAGRDEMSLRASAYSRAQALTILSLMPGQAYL
jgi:hypothetical protein